MESTEKFSLDGPWFSGPGLYPDEHDADFAGTIDEVLEEIRKILTHPEFNLATLRIR